MRYPGGKGISGVYQRLINKIPPHRVYIEPYLGGGALMRYKLPAEINIGLDVDPAVTRLWNDIGGIHVLCEDAILYLTNYTFKGDEFLYVDPPYLASTRRSGRAIYKNEYTREGHIKLLSVLVNLPCKVMVSGYWSDLYADYLNDWRRMSFSVRVRSGQSATEWVWMNYPEPVELHDYRYLGDSFRERERIRRRIERWKSKLDSLPDVEKNALINALI